MNEAIIQAFYKRKFENSSPNPHVRDALYTVLFTTQQPVSRWKKLISIKYASLLSAVGSFAAIAFALFLAQSVTMPVSASQLLQQAIAPPQLESGEMYVMTRSTVGGDLNLPIVSTQYMSDGTHLLINEYDQTGQFTGAKFYDPTNNPGIFTVYNYGTAMWHNPDAVTPEILQQTVYNMDTISADDPIRDDPTAFGEPLGASLLETVGGYSFWRDQLTNDSHNVQLFQEPTLLGTEVINGVETYKLDAGFTTVWLAKQDGHIIREVGTFGDVTDYSVAEVVPSTVPVNLDNWLSNINQTDAAIKLFTPEDFTENIKCIDDNGQMVDCAEQAEALNCNPQVE